MSKPHVACAIDVNDFDQRVIDVAASLARQFQTELDLVHVTLFPDPAGAAWPAYLGSPNTVISENRQLKKVGTKVEGVIVNRHHLSGIPDDKVVRFVERHSPQLLVMGSHVRNPLAQLFLGSVASKILRRVTCPVMIVKMNKDSDSSSASDSTDSSSSSQESVS